MYTSAKHPLGSHKTLDLHYCIKPGRAVYLCRSSSGTMEPQESAVHGYPQLHRKFGASLGHRKLCLEKNK